MDFCSSFSVDAAPECVAELLTGLFQVSQTRRGRQVEELIHHEETCTSDCVSLIITCLFKQRDYFFFSRWQSILSWWDLFKPPALNKSCIFFFKITLGGKWVT